MSAGLLAAERPLAELFDLALVDLDGVAYRGHERIPWASESLVEARARGMRTLFVTNNASRSPDVVAQQLTELGIPTSGPDVMTAAQAAAQLLATRLAAGAKVLVVGADALRDAVRAQGFEVVSSADEHPDAVAQGFSPDTAWPQLAEAAYAVADGAWYVASNRDLSLPTARGFAPGNGSLVLAVTSATGVTPDSAGKPEPTMYQLAIARAGGVRTLVVGDRLDTDLAGARAGDLPGLHVLTGVSAARDDVLAVPGQRPHYIGADLRALLQPHPAPVPDDEWWVCGEAAARVAGGRLELRPAGDAVDLVRAACAAAWAAADAGLPVEPSSVPDLPSV
ncbi:MAG: HAD family hydrolase [Cellulomonas sp. 14-74-6]|nr:MAG: HAD family hydrolase [Cellulomonas sp. 14-74-6]